FQKNIEQLQTYFSKENEDAKVRALPGEGVDVPIWVLGSSTDSAYLAAQMGLPYAFAAHFAPAQLMQALSIYREYFTPSAVLAQPYAMACINVIAADTGEEADYLATSMYKMFLGIFTNARSPLMPPFDPAALSGLWTPEQEYGVKQMLSHALIGDQPTIAEDLKRFVEATGIQEIMTISQIFDQQKKERSLKLFKEMLN